MKLRGLVRVLHRVEVPLAGDIDLHISAVVGDG